MLQNLCAQNIPNPSNRISEKPMLLGITNALTGMGKLFPKGLCFSEYREKYIQTNKYEHILSSRVL